jgi:hypothetical protein
MSSCRSSRALAIFLAMTVMPEEKFHPAAKCVTAAHDATSWGCRRQDFVRFVDANLLQKTRMLYVTVPGSYILQSDDNCHVDSPVWLSVPIHLARARGIIGDFDHRGVLPITYNHNPDIREEHHREKDQHVNRRTFPRSHGPIGPGAELGRVQWRDRRYYHWFSRYQRVWRRSRWPDLGDPGPSSRSEGGRPHPGRRPGSPSGRRQCHRKQRRRERICDAVLRK